MVRDIEKNSKKFYFCDVLIIAYTDKKIVSDCENFCAIHNSCSMEITKHAVGVIENGKLIIFRKKE